MKLQFPVGDLNACVLWKVTGRQAGRQAIALLESPKAILSSIESWFQVKVIAIGEFDFFPVPTLNYKYFIDSDQKKVQWQNLINKVTHQFNWQLVLTRH